MSDVLSPLDGLLPDLERLYQDVHAHPELSHQETRTAGVAGPGGSVAAVFADYDNTGKTSLFVSGLGGVRLYRNRGNGTFVDETEKAGLRVDPGELATSAVLFDADNDGFLDLVVSICSNLKSLPKKDSATLPDISAGGAIRYYRNNGDGTFTEKTSEVGLGTANGRARKVLFADFNNNGYMDLLIIRFDGSPLLYVNQGEGKFAEVTVDATFAPIAPLDAQISDFNHDGKGDLLFLAENSGFCPCPKGAVLLTGLGVIELSMSIPSIAAIKAQLRRLSLEKCKAYAGQALTCRTAAEVRALPLP